MRTLRLSIVTTVAVVTIAIASGSVTGVVAQEPCGSESAEPGDAEALEQIQPWVRPLGFEDPVGDFFLDHPIYEENFDAPGVFNEVPIPDALDITGVDLVPEEESFNIRVLLERACEPELRALLEPGRRTANVGIYFDVDRNGVSDFLAITSDQGAVILPETLDEIVGEAGLDITDTVVSFDVPRDLVGDRFDWMAFTAFAPIDGAFFATPLDFMFFAPPVDMYTPQDLPANVGFTTTYVGTGVQCQVTSSQYNSCPAQGSPPQASVPGTSYQGVLIYRAQCDGRGYAFWCISRSFFGKEAFDPTQLGWIARCPYLCGQNAESRWDQDADGLVDRILHTVKDADCGAYHDGDGDTFLDVMEHTYEYATNSLTSCNAERDYQNVSIVHDLRCLPTRVPYPDPISVPGLVN